MIHGREDRFLPVQASYLFAEHIPNAQLHVLPNTGALGCPRVETPDREVTRFRGLPRAVLARLPTRCQRGQRKRLYGVPTVG